MTGNWQTGELLVISSMCVCVCVWWIPGPAGARGLPGVAGPPGTTGSKGETGDMGSPGVPGTNGEKGELGAKGIPGPKGEQGVLGPKGAMGLNGKKGDQGELGMMGIPGPCSPAIQSSFTAALGTMYPPPDKPVPFTQVITNQQFHFDPIMGIYRAPVNGTYVFSYHLMVFSKVLKVGLFHNFNPIVKTTEPAQLGTASNQVVLHLVMGDRVWLQVKDNITNGMYADYESKSTFSECAHDCIV
uniref:C1q domain-containing protein n=1 Tax=Salmo trutta TaxID=8032 RepID=A0A674CAP5_SALTR